MSSKSSLPQAGPPPSPHRLVESPFPAFTVLFPPLFPGSPLTGSLPQCFIMNIFMHPTKFKDLYGKLSYTHHLDSVTNILLCMPYHIFLSFFKLIYLIFIYFWLRWVFIAARGLSLVVTRGL